MAPITLPLSYSISWSRLNNTITKLGEFTTDEGVGAVPPDTGNNFTITGLVPGSVYWLQITSSDGENSTPNTISLSGFTAVEGSTNYYHSNYNAILSGFYEVSGDPVVTIATGSSSTYLGILSISINEVDTS